MRKFLTIVLVGAVTLMVVSGIGLLVTGQIAFGVVEVCVGPAMLFQHLTIRKLERLVGERG